jgi:hypothetical protein
MSTKALAESPANKCQLGNQTFDRPGTHRLVFAVEPTVDGPDEDALKAICGIALQTMGSGRTGFDQPRTAETRAFPGGVRSSSARSWAAAAPHPFHPSCRDRPSGARMQFAVEGLPFLRIETVRGLKSHRSHRFQNGTENCN